MWPECRVHARLSRKGASGRRRLLLLPLSNSRNARDFHVVGYDIHLIRFVSGAPQPQPAGRIDDLLRRASESPPDEHGFTRVSWCGGEADVYGVPRTADDPVDNVMFSRPAAGDGIFGS